MPAAIETGSAACPECGARAVVTIIDLDFHLTCDACTYELWGEVTEDADD